MLSGMTPQDYNGLSEEYRQRLERQAGLPEMDYREQQVLSSPASASASRGARRQRQNIDWSARDLFHFLDGPQGTLGQQPQEQPREQEQEQQQPDGEYDPSSAAADDEAGDISVIDSHSPQRGSGGFSEIERFMNEVDCMSDLEVSGAESDIFDDEDEGAVTNNRFSDLAHYTVDGGLEIFSTFMDATVGGRGSIAGGGPVEGAVAAVELSQYIKSALLALSAMDPSQDLKEVLDWDVLYMDDVLDLDSVFSNAHCRESLGVLHEAADALWRVIETSLEETIARHLPKLKNMARACASVQPKALLAKALPVPGTKDGTPIALKLSGSVAKPGRPREVTLTLGGNVSPEMLWVTLLCLCFVLERKVKGLPPPRPSNEEASAAQRARSYSLSSLLDMDMQPYDYSSMGPTSILGRHRDEGGTGPSAAAFGNLNSAGSFKQQQQQQQRRQQQSSPQRRESVLSAIDHLSQELAIPEVRLALAQILGWPSVNDPTDSHNCHRSYCDECSDSDSDSDSASENGEASDDGCVGGREASSSGGAASRSSKPPRTMTYGEHFQGAIDLLQRCMSTVEHQGLIPPLSESDADELSGATDELVAAAAVEGSGVQPAGSRKRSSSWAASDRTARRARTSTAEAMNCNDGACPTTPTTLAPEYQPVVVADYHGRDFKDGCPALRYAVNVSSVSDKLHVEFISRSGRAPAAASPRPSEDKSSGSGPAEAAVSPNPQQRSEDADDRRASSSSAAEAHQEPEGSQQPLPDQLPESIEVIPDELPEPDQRPYSVRASEPFVLHTGPTATQSPPGASPQQLHRIPYFEATVSGAEPLQNADNEHNGRSMAIGLSGAAQHQLQNGRVPHAMFDRSRSWVGDFPGSFGWDAETGKVHVGSVYADDMTLPSGSGSDDGDDLPCEQHHPISWSFQEVVDKSAVGSGACAGVPGIDNGVTIGCGMAPEVKPGWAVLLSNAAAELVDVGNEAAEFHRVLDMMGESEKFNQLHIVELDERRRRNSAAADAKNPPADVQCSGGTLSVEQRSALCDLIGISPPPSDDSAAGSNSGSGSNGALPSPQPANQNASSPAAGGETGNDQNRHGLCLIYYRKQHALMAVKIFSRELYGRRMTAELLPAGDAIVRQCGDSDAEGRPLCRRWRVFYTRQGRLVGWGGYHTDKVCVWGSDSQSGAGSASQLYPTFSSTVPCMVRFNFGPRNMYAASTCNNGDTELSSSGSAVHRQRKRLRSNSKDLICQSLRETRAKRDLTTGADAEKGEVCVDSDSELWTEATLQSHQPSSANCSTTDGGDNSLGKGKGKLRQEDDAVKPSGLEFSAMSPVAVTAMPALPFAFDFEFFKVEEILWRSQYGQHLRDRVFSLLAGCYLIVERTGHMPYRRSFMHGHISDVIRQRPDDFEAADVLAPPAWESELLTKVPANASEASPKLRALPERRLTPPLGPSPSKAAKEGEEGGIKHHSIGSAAGDVIVLDTSPPPKPTIRRSGSLPDTTLAAVGDTRDRVGSLSEPSSPVQSAGIADDADASSPRACGTSIVGKRQCMSVGRPNKRQKRRIEKAGDGSRRFSANTAGGCGSGSGSGSGDGGAALGGKHLPSVSVNLSTSMLAEFELAQRKKSANEGSPAVDENLDIGPAWLGRRHSGRHHVPAWVQLQSAIYGHWRLFNHVLLRDPSPLWSQLYFLLAVPAGTRIVQTSLKVKWLRYLLPQLYKQPRNTKMSIDRKSVVRDTARMFNELFGHSRDNCKRRRRQRGGDAHSSVADGGGIGVGMRVRGILPDVSFVSDTGMKEDGIDQGGLTKAWLQQFCQQLVDSSGAPLQRGRDDGPPKLFHVVDDGTLFLNPLAPEPVAADRKGKGKGDGAAAKAQRHDLRRRRRWRRRILHLARLTGRVLGLAIILGESVPLRLHHVLCRHLLDADGDGRIRAADLKTLDGDTFNNLAVRLLKGLSRDNATGQWKLDWSHQNEEVLEPVDEWCVRVFGESDALTFSTYEPVSGTEVDLELPDEPQYRGRRGRDVTVTASNKIKFVESLIKYKLLGCIREPLLELRAGLLEVIPLRLLCVFDERELQLLIAGSDEISVAQWRRHCSYEGGGYTAASAQVAWFWSIMEGFNAEQQRKMLQFATARTAVPPGGFSQLQPQFIIVRGTSNTDSLPTAHTCTHQLELPLYSSKAQMQERLAKVLELESMGAMDSFGVA